jgi:hypothetical protein
MSIISAFMITYQCVILDFTLEATIRCCLDLCDYMYVNDGKSTDGTLDILYTLQREYGKDRLIIFERDWEHSRVFWTDQKNFLIDLIPNDYYLLAIDADEVFHEKDFVHIRMLSDNGYKAISFPVIHFYGRPTYYINGPGWYMSHTRWWRKDSGIKLFHGIGGCADDVVWPNHVSAHVFGHYRSQAALYHYGNCRHPRALGLKTKKADDLYANSDRYLDGSLPAYVAFDYEFDKQPVKLFKGTHPKYIKEWFESHKDQCMVYK